MHSKTAKDYITCIWCHINMMCHYMCMYSAHWVKSCSSSSDIAFGHLKQTSLTVWRLQWKKKRKKERKRKREGERETMPLNAAIIYPRDIASGGFLSVMKLLATLLRVGSIVYKKIRHTQMLNWSCTEPFTSVGTCSWLA